jgi:hypothetical protein
MRVSLQLWWNAVGYIVGAAVAFGLVAAALGWVDKRLRANGVVVIVGVGLAIIVALGVVSGGLEF